VKIIRVTPNNHKKAFEVHTRSGDYTFPYAVACPVPSKENGIIDIQVDDEMGREGFVYTLASGETGAIHIDHVLEYNQDPAYMTDILLYKLTICAQDAIKKSALSTREIIRRLSTSPAQFYRLLDPTNYRKSVRQLLSLLHALNYDVDVVLTRQTGAIHQSDEPVRISAKSVAGK